MNNAVDDDVPAALLLLADDLVERMNERRGRAHRVEVEPDPDEIPEQQRRPVVRVQLVETAMILKTGVGGGPDDDGVRTVPERHSWRGQRGRQDSPPGRRSERDAVVLVRSEPRLIVAPMPERPATTVPSHHISASNVGRCPCGNLGRVHRALRLCPTCFMVLVDFIGWIRGDAFDRDRARL